MKYVKKRASSVTKAAAVVACGILSAVISYGEPAYAAEPAAEAVRVVSEVAPQYADAQLPCVSIEATEDLGQMKKNVAAQVQNKGIAKYVSSDERYVENVLGTVVESGKSLTDEYVYEICKEVTKGTPDVSAEILFSIMGIESKYKPDAVNKNSGAAGLCGVAKLHKGSKTAEDLGISAEDFDEEMKDPVANAAMGARVLQAFYNDYKGYNPTMGHDDLMDRALGSYSGYGKHSEYARQAMTEEKLVASALEENSEVTTVRSAVAASPHEKAGVLVLRQNEDNEEMELE